MTISTLYDSGIGLAAALHVVATIPNNQAMEINKKDSNKNCRIN